MSQSAASNDTLSAILTTLRALLLLELRNQTDEAVNGSIEGLLYRAGFKNQVEIIELTGIPRSTVSRRLKEEGLT